MPRDQHRKEHRMKDRKEEFEYGFYWDCRKECGQKFGSIHDLPVIDGPGEKISESYRGGKVLDVGAAKEKLRKRMENNFSGVNIISAILEIEKELNRELVFSDTKTWRALVGFR